MVDMEILSSASDMKLEIRGFVLTGFDAPIFQQFIGLKIICYPEKSSINQLRPRSETIGFLYR
jgi:hypothetical protein